MPGPSEPGTRLTAIGAVPLPLVGVTRSQELLVRAVHDAVPEIADRRVGAFVEVTNGVGISVERSMYANADGRVWDVGTNAPATRVP